MPAALLLFKAKVQGYDRVEDVKHSKETKSPTQWWLLKMQTFPWSWKMFLFMGQSKHSLNTNALCIDHILTAFWIHCLQLGKRIHMTSVWQEGGHVALDLFTVISTRILLLILVKPFKQRKLRRHQECMQSLEQGTLTGFYSGSISAKLWNKLWNCNSSCYYLFLITLSTFQNPKQLHLSVGQSTCL